MSGKVLLVGAGPGDAGLLTLRGKEAILSAEVVLYDRLVGADILAMIPDSAERVDVGKESGSHPVPQHRINDLILEFAKAGKLVVRLKGGDPYLFGRGAEELEAVAKENIPFEVVPGITSALSVPAYAGIPVSHRDFASSVHIITAHKKSGDEPDYDYAGAVKLGGTLVFLMGLSSLPEVTAGLIAAGMDKQTPAALIENGTRQNQRKLTCQLCEIVARAKEEQFSPPSIFIAGGVCGLSDTLDWFSKLPLKGVSIVVTRPGEKSGLKHMLKKQGADVIDFPCIKTEPLPVDDRVFERINEYNWVVFTSPAGAELFFDGLKRRKLDIRSLLGISFAAVGAKTAEAVTSRGIAVDYVPEEYNARALSRGLPMQDMTKARVLLFRAGGGVPLLAETLLKRGFSVEDVPAYKILRESRCPDEVKKRLESGKTDFVTFTSASCVEGFAASLPGLDYASLKAVCIGGETAEKAREYGFDVTVSREATMESMVLKIRERCGK